MLPRVLGRQHALRRRATSTSSSIPERRPPMRLRVSRRSSCSTRGLQEGTLPETAYQVPVVTTADIAVAAYGSVALANAYFCGVFINPATVGGAGERSDSGQLDDDLRRRRARVGQCWIGGERLTLGNVGIPRHEPSREVRGHRQLAGNSGQGRASAQSPRTSGNPAVAYYSDIILKFIT